MNGLFAAPEVVFAKRFNPALITFRISGNAYISSMKNKPVMRNGDFIFRNIFH